MSQPSNNPPITGLFRVITSIELGVLGLTGVGLFFFPNTTRALWPWPVAPFNSHFLGAVYLASFAAIAVVLWGGRWAPARLGLWMLVVYTTPVLVVSFISLNRFDFRQWLTWGWFVLFIGIPLNSAYNLWLYRRLSPADPRPVPPVWRVYLAVQSALLTLYGCALLVAPATFTAFWPWHIDAFHGRMYCAMFLAGAVGSFLLLRGAAAVEILLLALAEGSFGLLAILGVVITDASQRRVNWSASSTWLWVGIFAILCFVGIGLAWLALARGRKGLVGTTQR